MTVDAIMTGMTAGADKNGKAAVTGPPDHRDYRAGNMAGRSYGKKPWPRQPNATTPLQLAEDEVLIASYRRHTLEQIAVARLHDDGAYGVEKFRISLEPRDSKGQPVTLRNQASEQIHVIQIPEPEAGLPYRPGPYDVLTPTASPCRLQSAACTRIVSTSSDRAAPGISKGYVRLTLPETLSSAQIQSRQR